MYLIHDAISSLPTKRSFNQSTTNTILEVSCLSNFVYRIYRHRRMYNKKSSSWYATPMRVAKGYDYIVDLQTEIVRRRIVDQEPIARRREMLPEDPRRIKKTLAPTTPPSTAELVRRHRTRMPKRLGHSSQSMN